MHPSVQSPSSERDLIALQRSTLYSRLEVKGTEFAVILPDLNTHLFLEELYSCTKHILKSADLLFNANKHRISTPNHHGRTLCNLIMRGFDDFGQHFPLHKLHPYLAQGVELFGDAVLVEKVQNYKAGIYNDICGLADSLNEKVSELRKQCHSPETRRLLSDFYRSSNDNRRGLLRFFDAIVAVCSRPLVIRLDFFYPTFRGRELLYADDVSFDEVAKHRDQIISLTRKFVGKSLLGYAWKIEHGALRGYHIHFLLVLNGNMKTRDVVIGNAICGMWRNEVTNGQGQAFNCNMKANAYLNRGVGHIDITDPTCFAGIRSIIDYMTKAQPLYRLVIPDGRRAYGRSAILSPPSGGAGRKRKKVAIGSFAEG